VGANDAAAAADKAVLRSQDGDTHAVYSPDGTKIAFLSETDGNVNVWVSDGEGGNRVKITDLKDADPSRPEWSPDGKWLLYEVSTDQGWDIYKVAPAAAAKPARVTVGGEGIAWARDGKAIYYQQRGTIYEYKLEGGGEPRAITSGSDRRGRAGQPTPSMDGKYLYYRNGRAIWREPVKGGEQELVFEPGAPFLLPHIEAGRAGIYFEEFDPGERAFTISLYSFDTKRITHVLRLEHLAFGRGRNDIGRSNDFSVSADGKFVLHPRIDQSQTNLVVVENFR
jgi:dipeptidyl aminopeptidase/acylaminoacyl peptidase